MYYTIYTHFYQHIFIYIFHTMCVYIYIYQYIFHIYLLYNVYFLNSHFFMHLGEVYNEVKFETFKFLSLSRNKFSDLISP